ncbi:MAG: DnaB-like helicase C-terminal domain-containing protein [Anaerolineales bacterium]
MPRAGTLGNPTPYDYFGTFAGLPFWPGGLTLLAAEPGVGKTSWLLRMMHQAAEKNFPAAIGCYEHTAEELKFRLTRQAEAAVAGPHEPPEPEEVSAELARANQAVLLPLSDREDTLRAIEETLIEDYAFPRRGPALLAVDYLQRIPVVGITGKVAESERAGEAAAGLRQLFRRRGWAVVAAAALKSAHFGTGSGIDDLGLGALLGDERVPYEADRVYLMGRTGEGQGCGCVPLSVSTLKNRAGPLTTFSMNFWGARFFPALAEEGAHP